MTSNSKTSKSWATIHTRRLKEILQLSEDFSSQGDALRSWFMISLIAIIGKNRELGKDNKLIWNIPEDLKRFRKITSGHPVIMGRKTFQSIGRPLPKRVNIVISADKNFSAEGVTVVHSLDEALGAAKKSQGSEEVFVIGGGNVYAQAIGRADRLYLTIVDATAPADTFFPDYSTFKKVISEEPREASGFKFVYKTLER